MWIGIAKNVSLSMLVVILSVALVVLALHYVAHVQFHISSAALTLGIVGSTLAFIGSNLIADALGRYDAQTLPQWKWGNKLQSIGFALTIAALLVN